MTPSRDALDAIEAREQAAHVDANRDRRRDLALTALACLGWSALGIMCILWSAHTTDFTYGTIAFYGGLGIGNAGIIFSLAGAYRRGEARGDW